jgi:TetR/AcrR family fatty acid metabolism transcriptional regulator
MESDYSPQEVKVKKHGAALKKRPQRETDIHRNRDSRNKKQLIIKASEKLIAEKGVRNCNISKIAKNAGVVDSILYHYFVNKEDLLFATLAEQLKKASEELETHLFGIVDPLSKLGKVVWYHLHMNDYDTEFARITKHLLLECRSTKQFYQHECFTILRGYVNDVRLILEEGIEKGIFHQNFDPALVTEMIFGILDEESLSCFASKEVDKTIPDFNPIMNLITAMIGNERNKNADVHHQDKRMIILKAAKQLFAEKGYDKATVIEIANLANVAEGTVYEYFKNKKDLFYSIPTKQFLNYKNSMQEFITSRKPLVNLRRLFYLYFLHLTTDREYLMIYLHDIIRDRQFYSTDAFKSYFDCVADLNPILDEGKELGIFAPDVDNRVFRNLFLGTFTHLAIRWFVLNKRTPLQMMDEFNQVATLLCRAVVTEKGLLEPLGFSDPF